MWTRYRFRANQDDYRPVRVPPPGPYWCTGYRDGYAILLAYLPLGEPLTEWWPDATEIVSQDCEHIDYSSRFPRPKKMEQ